MDDQRLKTLHAIQLAEDMVFGVRPRYHYDGRGLKWGEYLTSEQIQALKENAEIFLLHGRDDRPYMYITCDGYGQYRQAPYEVDQSIRLEDILQLEMQYPDIAIIKLAIDRIMVEDYLNAWHILASDLPDQQDIITKFRSYLTEKLK